MPKNVDDLRRDRLAAAQAMQAAADALTALDLDGSTSEEALAGARAAFDAATATHAKAHQAVERAEAVEAALAASAAPVDLRGGLPASLAAAAANPEHQGVEIGMMVHALANSRGDVAAAARRLEKDGFSGVAASMSGATESAGGALLPRPTASGVIELLRPRVTVRRAGAVSMPMPAGQLRHAKQTASATAAYRGENTRIASSTPTVGKIDQTFKSLSAIVPIGNALLRHSLSVQVAQMVRNDLIEVMALREDLGFLRNDGTGDLPKGIVSWCLSGNLQSAVQNGAAVVEAAIRKAVNLVEVGNVPMLNCGWIMRPDVKNYLASIRDANGFLIFPSIDQNGTLRGFPIYTTTQLPSNLGVGTDESEVIFADFSQLMIGDAFSLSIGVSTEATYIDGSSNTISAFQHDLTLMRAISEHDFAPRQDAAISVIRADSWTL